MSRAEELSFPSMLEPCAGALDTMHRGQTRRDPWPDFEAFDRSRYSQELRRAAAVQWAARARAEYGSVHQFTQVSHALATARVALPILGALARLITDEVRHAELCAAMALACDPTPSERTLRFPTPATPWPGPPQGSEREPLLAWASRAILVACCLGETLSRPMLEAIATRASDPVAEGVARQILRDEHLHATFGWDALAALLPQLSDGSRAALTATLTRAFGSFERSTACGIRVEELAGRAVEVHPGSDDDPNLGTLTDQHYAAIFFATVEHEILPRLTALGIDGAAAWAARPIYAEAPSAKA